MEAPLPLDQRLLRLFDRLGIRRAHLATQQPDLIANLLEARPGAVASAILLCPDSIEPRPFRTLGPRLLIFLADSAPAQRSAAALPDATVVPLLDYAPLGWSDINAERLDEIAPALDQFLARTAERDGQASVALSEGNGEVAGITYRIRGAGPPLVLFPFGLAPSQWAPLLPALSQRYCTISVGGAHLGIVSLLEERGHAAGYLDMVGGVVNRLELQPGQSVLEVGCGTGVLCRWLARRTEGANPIVGIDISPYLLREAADFAEREGLGGKIDFRHGNAEKLPLETGQFDATVSFTVMEEVDADRMVAEMVRVTKPGGKLGVVVRATDLPPQPFVNVPLRPELKARIASMTGPKSERGCADASLYQRLYDAGLRDLTGWPEYTTFYPGRDVPDSWINYGPEVAASLDGDEVGEWNAAIARALEQGTLFLTWACHCAVGTKPSGTSCRSIA